MTADQKWRIRIEILMTSFGILGSLATIPQIIKVHVTHSHVAHGQSLITWAAYAFICVAWICYGLYFKKMAILITNSLYLFMYMWIVVGIVMHAGLHW